jgi:acyl carrier protein
MTPIETATRESIEQLVRDLLVEDLDVDPEQLTPDATMEELDLDSLDLVEIGQAVERRYGVRIKAKDAEGVTDLRGVVEMIYDRVRARDGAG